MFDINGKMDERSRRILSEQTIPPRYGRSPAMGSIHEIVFDYIKLAAESRARELEAAIQRFRDCGVELARFTIQERGEVTHLCVDGVSRFNWRAVCHLPNWDANATP